MNVTHQSGSQKVFKLLDMALKIPHDLAPNALKASSFSIIVFCRL